MSLFKHKVPLLTALRKPVVRAIAPICMTCGRFLDGEELVEGYPGQSGFAKVLGKHHGAEELVTFDMGSIEWDFDELPKFIRGHKWFDPTLVEK